MAYSFGEISLEQQHIRAARIFLIPVIVILFLVAGWPLLRSIYFSFTNTSLTNLSGGEWIGFDNYLNRRELSSGRVIWRGTLVDATWWNAVWNTIKFAFVSVGLETFFGLIVALVLNAEFKGRAFVRAAILIPWAIPTVVSAKMWAWMLNDQFGIINDLFLRLGIISQKVAWIANPDFSMSTVIAVDVWKTTPFMALLILAGLQTVPKDIYEAAKVDGVHPIKVLWKVTLPLIHPAIMVAVIFRTLDALRVFDLVYLLANNSTTKTMSIISRENLIEFDKFAYGSAQSTLLFAIILIFVSLYIWLGKVNLSGEAGQ